MERKMHLYFLLISIVTMLITSRFKRRKSPPI